MSFVSGINALCTRLENYLTPDQIADIRRAYLYSEKAHDGQFRRNGDPYITHPLAVANILCDMHMDHQSIMAAMLHDVIEDTGITKVEITDEFGEEVAELVDGVTKLTKVKFNTKAEAQAENFRKMILAMTQDIRVILVKLADRLHNMRTLDVLTPEKRRRIANETLEIYSPIANRLGMNEIRIEFEELGFEALFPMRAPLIKKAVRAARGNRKEIVSSIKETLEKRLTEEGVSARVMGREKHLYGIYQKMRDKQKSFSEIMDMYGFRVITENVDACYRALGIVHTVYKPIPGKFKDYIAIPKANGYQSLHTIVKGQRGVPIEIQIRTEAMEAMANNGIAAHWLYKNDGFANATQTRAREWLKSLLEIQQNAGDSMEFIENVKIDLFPDEVYVFTPNGRILTLPMGATAVDFAYAVHTDVGNTCVATRIDNRLSPLSLPLKTGQTVEIVTVPGTRPNPAWLSFAITSKARSSIRHFLKDQQQSEAVDLGRRLLEKTLSTQGSSLTKLPPEQIQAVLQELGLANLDALCEDIGIGNRVPQLVAARLLPEGAPESDAAKSANSPATRGIAIRGTEGLVVTYARCCRPLPGDTIVGHLSAGRGIVIHRDNCNNVMTELRDNPDKCMTLRWAEKVDREFPSELRIEVDNQRGLIAEIAREITDYGANIDGITMQEKGSRHAVMQIALQVRDRIHFARIIKRIRVISGVEKITRVKA
ncbi:MAG: bifunctional GTP diphosphokinase/guanosine-3',5'-bis pyrophosphate 3'-pyrophosphohydrolase [Moraxellaceae bacterium]|nr:bifunctional GTP diphosphokinase/guanosine-3',5'-bis pyrophosphate 3'-pyrophosphohydrolase [Moraxellaceae bacterium]MBP8852556.1 bifunctional GTP diphosphokinase/guanosine-3',5'-bis pyrophosphate 3'-pyrophosphohydrolase [Moraxellaceae bacterium]MBP9044847.1 bifunctional GTP diphosphokinase/guanosine-3',5'-bis pyrophosphate 3'-pyrophosphohydrolase [Moraxellaceae bacterium]MBP9731567.1 bifunctional GTP diphosphokinase/guanosine-3',5'-bis pyrophosphate 3'-pyrophosphohydrolase [Moraxellaceae bact